VKISEHEHRHHRRETAAALGVTLRALRRDRLLSQEDLARAAGLSTHAYGCLERGRSPSGGVANPTMDTLLRIFKVLGVDPPSLDLT